MENSRVYCVTYDIGKQFGGMTASVLKRAKVLGERKNLEVDIITFSLNYNLRANIEYLRKDKIGKRTTVYNLYDYLCEDEFPLNKKKEHYICSRGYSYEKDKDKQIYRIFQNGKLEMIKDFEEYNGALSSISYLNNNLDIDKKDEYDRNGNLRRTVIYNSINGFIAQEFFYRPNGSCYLRKNYKYGQDDKKTVTMYHFNKKGEVINVFNSHKELKDYFLNSLVSRFEHNFFVIDSKYMFPYLISYKNSCNNVYKVYMNHSPHLKAPYKYDSELRPSIESIYKDVKSHDAIVILTEEQKKDLELRFGELDNCYVIPHSYSGEITKSDFKRRNLKKALSVARFVPGKQNEHIIKAFSKVVKEVPDAILEFYGFGESEDSMRELITELNLENNVFIKGFTNNVEEVFRTSAMTFMASRFEGQGLSILESLSFGCPVISYKTKYGPSDMIKQGENGYLVEYNNHEELAERAIELFKNPDKIEELSNNSYESLEEFTEDIFVDRWINLFNKLVKDREKKELVNSIKSKIEIARWHKKEENIFHLRISNNIHKDYLNQDRVKNIRLVVKERDSEENFHINVVDNIEFNDKCYLDFKLNLNNIFNGKSIPKGIWDFYIAFNLDEEKYQERLGNREDIFDKYESTSNVNKDIIKPYFTIYNNFSIKVP